MVKYRVKGTYIHSRMEGEVDTVKLNTQSPQIAEGLSKQTEALTGTGQTQENTPKRRTAGLFITPVIQFDSETLSVIFRVRDGLSGEVKQEYPQQSVIKGRQAMAEAAVKQTESKPSSLGDIPVVSAPRAEATNNGGVEVSAVSVEGDISSGGQGDGVGTSTAGVAQGLGNT